MLQASQETQAELQWIVAQRLLSALTAPGFDLSRLQKSYHYQNFKNDTSHQACSGRRSSHAVRRTPIFGHTILEAVGNTA